MLNNKKINKKKNCYSQTNNYSDKLFWDRYFFKKCMNSNRLVFEKETVQKSHKYDINAILVTKRILTELYHNVYV